MDKKIPVKIISCTVSMLFVVNLAYGKEMNKEVLYNTHLSSLLDKKVQGSFHNEVKTLSQATKKPFDEEARQKKWSQNTISLGYLILLSLITFSDIPRILRAILLFLFIFFIISIPYRLYAQKIAYNHRFILGALFGTYLSELSLAWLLPDGWPVPTLINFIIIFIASRYLYFPTLFLIHEPGHYYFGKWVGAPVSWKRDDKPLYWTKRLTRFEREAVLGKEHTLEQRFVFTLGGPATNIIAGLLFFPVLYFL